MNSLWRNIKWESKKRLEAFKIPMIFYLALNILFLVIPKAMCQYMALHLYILVFLVNMIYALSALAFLVYPIMVMGDGYDTRHYELEKLTNTSSYSYIVAKIIMNVPTVILLFCNAWVGEYIMGKFATSNVSYFKMNLQVPVYQILFDVTVFLPILYLFVYLMLYERSYTLRRFMALILTLILYSLFGNIHASILEILVIKAILCIPIFWRAGKILQKA
ncbi:MAG: hypothetical protein ACERKN_12855 [Velocimicrobium sp.]